MDGVHDMGGMHGFGRVVVEPEEPVFHHEWEAKTLVMAKYAIAAGHRQNLDQERYDIERIEPAQYLSASYYERWLLGLERCLIRSGLISKEQVEAREREIVRGSYEWPEPTRNDELSDRILHLVTKSRPTAMEHPDPPRFTKGAQVQMSRDRSHGHTRLPRYAKGRFGVVEDYIAAFANPTLAATGKKVPEHVYVVGFESAELWGEAAEPDWKVRLDVFECDLHPA